MEAAPGFEAEIRPLFRETDRVEMDFMFDLWSYEDVRAAAADILARLEDGTMPCDGAWDDERVNRFRRWIEGGFQP